MKQTDYELILACIQHGAPAVAPQLVNSLNTVVEKSNQLTELQRVQAEEKQKAEIARVEAEAKVANEKAKALKPTEDAAMHPTPIKKG